MKPFGCELSQNSSSDLLSATVQEADAGSSMQACITCVLLASRPETDLLRADQSTKFQHGAPGKQRHRDCKAEAKWEECTKYSITAENENIFCFFREPLWVEKRWQFFH